MKVDAPAAEAEPHRAWVLLVTDGTILEFPPELYVDLSLATREAMRWAEILAMGNRRLIRRPFEGRWEVGPRDIRLVPAQLAQSLAGREPWVGTHWTRDGYPDPEAVLLPGRIEAKAWAESPYRGEVPVEVHDHGHELVAVFGVGDREEYSRVTRLKQVTLNLLG